MTAAFETAPRLVEINGRHLAVQRCGAGPLVLLETGGGGGGIGVGWNGLPERLAPFASVIAYDRAGVGLSAQARCHDPPPTVADRARDLAALLDAIAPGVPAILVGWSLGGLIVQHYAAQHPARVAGLVLIDPTPVDSFDAIPGWLHWLVDLQLATRLLRRLARWGVLATPWMQRRLRRMLSGQFGPRFDRERLLPVILRAMGDPALHEGLLWETLRLRAGLPQTATVIGRAGLPAVPLILLQAGFRGHGKLAAKVAAQVEGSHARLVAGHPHAELRKLDGVSHHLPFEAPEAIVAAARDVIERSRPVSTGSG